MPNSRKKQVPNMPTGKQPCEMKQTTLVLSKGHVSSKLDCLVSSGAGAALAGGVDRAAASLVISAESCPSPSSPAHVDSTETSLVDVVEVCEAHTSGPTSAHVKHAYQAQSSSCATFAAAIPGPGASRERFYGQTRVLERHPSAAPSAASSLDCLSSGSDPELLDGDVLDSNYPPMDVGLPEVLAPSPQREDVPNNNQQLLDAKESLSLPGCLGIIQGKFACAPRGFSCALRRVSIWLLNCYHRGLVGQEYMRPPHHFAQSPRTLEAPQRTYVFIRCIY